MLKKIKVDASPDEFSSPFFLSHKEVCEEWENFILGQNGIIKGKFTSWALIIKAKLKIHREWYIELKKTTMSNSSLLLPSKWNVLKYTLMKCDSANLDLPSFEIYKKRFLGRFKISLLSKSNSFGANHILTCKKNSNIEDHELLKILKSKELINKLEFAKYNKQTNKIEIRFQELISEPKLFRDLFSI